MIPEEVQIGLFQGWSASLT